ncbi:TPA: hypothetical protein DCZ36_03685 [Candidatus Gracilibacteria bacterium]|nr:hypothetical protein [Candidatus Gracilibacteria bacterium]
MNLTKLFLAYYDCRKNKRKTASAIKFELDYESNLIQLHEEIMNRTYTVGKSIAFIVDRPVKREIFAGDFRDRIVHHFIVNELNPIFENLFIHDSYSCRVGKGTSFGIARMEHFMRASSDNYRSEAWILKLDIAGFFMSIDRTVLLGMIENIIDTKYSGEDSETLRFLVRTVIGNDPTKNCVIKGKRTDWQGLPRNKSLFFAPPGVGLPIGNLTSQIFANLYLHPLDEFIKKTLKIQNYGRYVDDFVLLHPSRELLESSIPKIEDFLTQKLYLTLHPDKITLRPTRDGFSFLGAYLKPYRTYIGNRTKGNFLRAIREWNEKICHCERNEVKRGNPENIRITTYPRSPHRSALRDDETIFLSSVNSYLGILKQFSTYRLRKKMLSQNLSAHFWNEFYVSGGYGKIVRKRRKTGI